MTRSHLSTFVIVEDDLLVRTVLSRLLGTLYEQTLILDFEDSQAAQTYCDHYPIDLLLTDYDVPPIDGLALAKHVRKRQPQAAIILATGAWIDPQAVEKAGVDLILPKPWQRDSVKKAINSIWKQPLLQSSVGR